MTADQASPRMLRLIARNRALQTDIAIQAGRARRGDAKAATRAKKLEKQQVRVIAKMHREDARLNRRQLRKGLP